jgi:caffeoyl-CoA O-methyltransferase
MIPLIDERLEEYATEHTSEESDLMRRLAEETVEKMERHRMLTGRLEGTFLKLLVRMLQAKRILEVGTFTGYGTLMMASSLPDGGRIITCDVDPSAEVIASRYFAESRHAEKIELKMGPALETLRELSGPFDLVFIDADKKNYPRYYELCLERTRIGGAIVVDNVLWSGRVLNPADEESRAIATLNDRVQNDDRADNVLLPIRDGVMLIVKK